MAPLPVPRSIPPLAPPRPAAPGRHGMLLPVLAALAFLLQTGPVHAWVSSTATSSDPTPARWDLANNGTDQEEVDGGRVVYRLHIAGSDDIGDGRDLEAVRDSFAAWERVPTSEMAWTEGPAISDRSIGNDDVFSIFWDEVGDFPVGGALAVTFTYIYTSGPEVGEIVDTNIVFNGRDYNWSTDGAPGTYDIAAVATHEIGHSFGLDHSPVGSDTMWPYTSRGEVAPRTPAGDDAVAISVKYPAPGFLASTGTLSGAVSQSGSGLLHGAHVVVVDSDGNVEAATLSLADGSYEIAGLPPGNHTVWAEAIGTPRFGTGNLAGYYGSADTGYPALFAEEPVGISAGSTTTLDLLLPAGPGQMVPRYFGRGADPWGSKGIQVTAGDGVVEVGMAVENMPMSGQPLSVSGSDLPVISTRFGTVGGYPAAIITIDVHPGVAPGERSLVVTSGGERSRGTGVLGIMPPVDDDSDGDTISDSNEGAPARDSDGDTTPDFLDLDSDNDSIADFDEAGDADINTAPTDTDGDTLPDCIDTDADNDTVADAHEAGDADPATLPVDTDGDALRDYLDPDSDNDSVADAHEAGDGDPATPPVDTDGDTLADLRDPDADGDYLTDAQEAGDADPATAPLDSDGDTLADFRDPDSDGDTILDIAEAGDVATGTPPFDRDGDTIPDFLDDDSDADTVRDAWEAGDADPATAPFDSDGDTVPDFLDTDSDNDTVLDAWEAGDADPATAPWDFDGDTLADLLDDDTDGDTLGDALEAGDADPGTAPVDSDGDTLADLLDDDSDQDGVPDGQFHETGGDFDGDTLENFRDPDADNGGEPDGSEMAGGRNPLDGSDDFGSLPGPVPDGRAGSEPVRVARSGSRGLTLTWAPAPNATSYRVYRGTFAALAAGAWDHAASPDAGSCDTGGATSLTDSQETGDSISSYYLVSGVNGSGEGGLGWTSGGAARPPGTGCGR